MVHIHFERVSHIQVHTWHMYPSPAACSSLVDSQCELCSDGIQDVDFLVRCTQCADGYALATDGLSCVGKSVIVRCTHCTNRYALATNCLSCVGESFICKVQNACF